MNISAELWDIYIKCTGFVILSLGYITIVNADDKNQELIQASFNGDLLKLKKLLDDGADVNTKTITLEHK